MAYFMANLQVVGSPAAATRPTLQPKETSDQGFCLQCVAKTKFVQVIVFDYVPLPLCSAAA